LEKIRAFGICLYKYNKDSLQLLLCKSIISKNRWGFLKGVALKGETSEETAIREFSEESGIKVEKKYLEEFFIQKNELKNIGIYLVNSNNIPNLEEFFKDDILKKIYLSSENSEVKFFDIKSLPMIKKKQLFLSKDIVKFLQ